MSGKVDYDGDIYMSDAGEHKVDNNVEMTNGREKKYFIVRVHGGHNSRAQDGSVVQELYSTEELKFINKHLKIIKITPYGETCISNPPGWKALWRFSEKDKDGFKEMFHTTGGAKKRGELPTMLRSGGMGPNESMDVSIGPPEKKWFFSYGYGAGAVGIYDIDLPDNPRINIKTSHTYRTDYPSTQLDNGTWEVYKPNSLTDLATYAANKNQIFNVLIVACRTDESVITRDDSVMGALGEGLGNLDINSEAKDDGYLSSGGKRRRKTKRRRKRRRKTKRLRKRRRKTKRLRKRRRKTKRSRKGNKKKKKEKRKTKR